MVHNDVEGRLGFVGYLTGLNQNFLESLWRENLLPVAPCLGIAADNELYNINADHMAAACAEFLSADRLIYLTDVAGVLDGDKVLSAVTCEQIERLVQSRVVSGGMILKLEAACRALEGGVSEVCIVGGASPDSLLRAWNTPEISLAPNSSEHLGTRILRQPPAASQAVYSTAQ
jgi:acetylglutamate kinase